MRNAIEIYVWMRRNGYSVGRIQRELGFKNHGTVCNTLAGRAHNRRILQLLCDQGCPRKILGMPSGRQKKKA